MEITKKELQKAIDELNDKIIDEPIEEKEEKGMRLEILSVAKLIEKGDEISKGTMETIKALKEGRKAKTGKKAGKVSKEKKETKKAKKPTEKTASYTRMDSIISVIEKGCKKGLTVNKVIERAHQLYSNETGQDGPISGQTASRATLTSLVHFNILHLDEETKNYVFK